MEERETFPDEVEAQLQSEVLEENQLLISQYSLASGDIDGHDVEVSSAGDYVKVNIDGFDDNAVFSLKALVGSAYERLSEEGD